VGRDALSETLLSMSDPEMSGITSVD